MPLKYKDLGKSVKDLLTKRYDYDYTLQTTNKSKDGLTMSSDFTMEERKVLSGSAKMEYEDQAFGDVEVNMKVNGEKEDQDTNLKCTFKKLMKGAEVAVSCNVIPELTVEKTYKKDAIALNSKLTTDFAFNKASFTANGAFTHSNFGVGLSGCVDLISKEPTDVGAALQFKSKPHTVSAVMKKLHAETKEILLGYHNTSVDDLQVGVHAKIKTTQPDVSLLGIFGLAYSVNPTTSLKAKFDTDSTLSYNLEYQLSNPALKVNFAHEIKDFSGKESASNWGFGLTFGDY